MEYGIPTLMEMRDAETLTRFCAENGFAFVEMNMTFPWFQQGNITAGMLRQQMERYGVGYTIHLHDQVNPFEFSPEMREGHLNNLRFAMELAGELSLTRLNMHLLPGTYTSKNGNKVYLYEQCRAQYMDYVREFRTFTEEKLKGTNAVLCIENTSGYRGFHKEAILELLKSDRFGLTLDIGHSFRAGGEDEQFTLEHAERLRHFHIHDCSVKSNHLGFGAGALDIVRYLKMAGRHECTAVIEVKESSALVQSKQYMIEKGLWQEMA